MTYVQLVATARFFRPYGRERLRVRVYDDGNIRVWDEIAWHYTLCHELSERDAARLRRIAAKVPPLATEGGAS